MEDKEGGVVREKEGEIQRYKERERGRDTETQREREKEGEIQTETKRESDRETQRETIDLFLLTIGFVFELVTIYVNTLFTAKTKYKRHAQDQETIHSRTTRPCMHSSLYTSPLQHCLSLSALPFICLFFLDISSLSVYLSEYLSVFLCICLRLPRGPNFLLVL